jgi:quercetin dioxygenase-like cupin family protein
MSEAQAHLYSWQDVLHEQLSPTIGRRMITGDRVMLAQIDLEAGAVVPTHVHEHEQISCVVEGLLRFWLGEDEEQTFDVAAGDVLHIPSNLPHRAEALERTLATDVFCPPRRDWLDGDDAYLRGER